MIDAKIVVDSSANMVVGNPGISSVPLKIITDHKEYVDDAILDTEAMVTDLLSYSGRSSTACPAPQDWLNCFEDKPYVFCVAITSNLSGSCNAANIAKLDYEHTFPGRRVCVVDTLSAAGEMQLIAEKLQELIAQGLTFEEVCRKIQTYQQKTGLIFMLESLKNLANNGRVSKITAKAAGILGIRVVGRASAVGTLEQLAKCRGEKKATEALLNYLKEFGYKGGKVCISHCLNPAAAQTMKAGILAMYPEADIDIRPTSGLCSFYAEKGGLLIGFEK